MPTAVDLVIKGLALCFYRDQFWNVVFFCDDAHPSVIKRRLTAPVFFRKNGIDVDITFDEEHIEQNQEDPFGLNSDLLFNLSAEYAHGTTQVDGQAVSNLQIVRRRNEVEGRDIAWMKVPRSTLRVETLIEHDYYVQEQDFPGAPVEIIGRVAKEVIVRFTMDGPVRMFSTDRVEDPGPPEELLTLEPQQNKIELIFDNDCQEECKHNDFLDLYDFVYGGTKTLHEGGPDVEIQFAGGQIKQAMFNGRRTSPLIARADGPATPAHGNCEVVGTDPPPSGP
jgi:hypothetical protein